MTVGLEKLSKLRELSGETALIKERREDRRWRRAKHHLSNIWGVCVQQVRGRVTTAKMNYHQIHTTQCDSDMSKILLPRLGGWEN